MIYFTSDLHFGHRAILNLADRPFGDVGEMNQCLIDSFNARVRPGDTTYFLGDLVHRIPVESANALISKLNGSKVLIRGNHDKGYDPGLFTEICDFKQIYFEGTRFVLMHYPLLEWPGYYRGAVHCHGHQHNTASYNIAQREADLLRYDVGVDANGYAPVSAVDVLRFFGLGK